MADFVMPSLGADMGAGTLVAWHKNPGDHVSRGEIIAEVETDKGIIDVEVFSTGVLEQILVPVGEKVPVGTVLARIGEQGAAPTVTPPPAPHSPKVQVVRLPMSPSARRLARELGVDPATVHGTGPGGAITREDIQQSAAALPIATAGKPGQPAPSAVPPLDASKRIRIAIAAAMARSKREIPHYYLSNTIDFHAAQSWLNEENLKRPITERLLCGVLLLKATALALHEVPELNALWDGEHAIIKGEIHLGVAVSLRQGGLIAPAIHNADRKSLDELMTAMRDLVSRARTGGLRSSELSDSTITVTNLGEQGVEAVFGIIYPPQVALVGFGKVVERPWSINGALASRPVVTSTLSADHRVSDGHRGGLFLAAVDRLLQEPEKL